MIEAILIWLYLSLGNILTGAFMVSFAAILAMSIFWMICFMDVSGGYSSEQDKAYFEAANSAFKLLPIKTIILVTILFAVYPDKDDLKYIVGGALVWNGAKAAQEIEGVQELPENLVGAMNHFLESIQEKKDD